MRTLSLVAATVALAATGAVAHYLRPQGQLPATSTSVTDVCWKGTHDRGVGKPISTCHPPLVKSGWLCYPECATNYTGVGPVCWENCPPGWIDEGALCREAGHIKTIAKKSYGRGVGKPLQCKLDEQYDAGLCYPFCPDGYYGVGPVCWEACSGVPGHDVDGGALCCTSAKTCTKKIRDLCAGLPIAIAKALIAGGNATEIEEAAIDAIDAVLGYVMPLCSTL